MNERRTPPPVPTWILTRLLTGPRRDAIVGDLVEAHHDGRSDAWYWRQAIRAVASAFLAEIRRRLPIALSAVLLGTYLTDVFMLLIRPSWIYRVDAWYRVLINWLIAMEWDGLRHLAYDLGLGFLTTRLLYCSLAAA